mmetsp:Transcript_48001/g.126633  ORF Transcript_48001/g.126633 Transcript_48001/m.126633 type:complete len:513 (-) Transcript_48001:1880-3418(-)
MMQLPPRLSSRRFRRVRRSLKTSAAERILAHDKAKKTKKHAVRPVLAVMLPLTARTRPPGVVATFARRTAGACQKADAEAVVSVVRRQAAAAAKVAVGAGGGVLLAVPTAATVVAAGAVSEPATVTAATPASAEAAATGIAAGVVAGRPPGTAASSVHRREVAEVAAARRTAGGRTGQSAALPLEIGARKTAALAGAEVEVDAAAGPTSDNARANPAADRRAAGLPVVTKSWAMADADRLVVDPTPTRRKLAASLRWQPSKAVAGNPVNAVVQKWLVRARKRMETEADRSQTSGPSANALHLGECSLQQRPMAMRRTRQRTMRQTRQRRGRRGRRTLRRLLLQCRLMNPKSLTLLRARLRRPRKQVTVPRDRLPQQGTRSQRAVQALLVVGVRAGLPAAKSAAEANAEGCPTLDSSSRVPSTVRQTRAWRKSRRHLLGSRSLRRKASVAEMIVAAMRSPLPNVPLFKWPLQQRPHHPPCRQQRRRWRQRRPFRRRRRRRQRDQWPRELGQPR